MNIRKSIAGAITALLVGGGLALASVAPANATYEETPTCVPSDAIPAWTEDVLDIEYPAVGEPTIEVENPDYVPAVEEVSHIVYHEAVTETVRHEAITHTEWKYTRHGGYGFIWVNNDAFKYIKGDGSGTNDKPRHGEFYERTQHTREVIDTEAWDEVIVVKEAWEEKVIDVEAQPAQGEPTITVPNPDYQEAWTEITEDIYHPEVPAVECPVTLPAAPTASAVAVCGEATVTLGNPDATAREIDEQLTASFVIYVDDEFYGAYAVAAGETHTETFTFSEDTGDHVITVFQAGTSEWKSIGEWTVPSDCQIPPVTPEEPEEPVVPEEPTDTPASVQQVAARVAAPLSSSEQLAETGAGPVWPLALGGGLLAALGAGSLLLARRRARVQ